MRRDDFRCDFDAFWWAWGHILWFLRVLETGLKFNDFSWLPSGSQGLRQYAQRVVTGRFPGHTPPSRLAALYRRHNTTSSIQEQKDTKNQDTERKKCRWHRMQVRQMPRSPVAPQPRSRRISTLNIPRQYFPNFPKTEKWKLTIWQIEIRKDAHRNIPARP